MLCARHDGALAHAPRPGFNGAIEVEDEQHEGRQHEHSHRGH